MTISVVRPVRTGLWVCGHLITMSLTATHSLLLEGASACIAAGRGNGRASAQACHPADTFARHVSWFPLKRR